MAIDLHFIESIKFHLTQDGWQISEIENHNNPLRLSISKDEIAYKLLIHARRLTYQASQGENPSNHNRPLGEMHLQMIFDGDKRGSGSRNFLRFEPNTKTVLLGFYHLNDFDYLIAAFDPDFHREYGYSKSLQIKDITLQKAARQGLSTQSRKNSEVIIAFHISELARYLELSASIHQTLKEVEANLTELSQETLEATESENLTNIPELSPQERRRLLKEVSRLVRNANFARGIRAIYERCAICGFQYDAVLDAAHIIPVGEGGLDTYDNGMGLCPNCHRMYDKGFILVDGSYNIYINTKFAEEYQSQNRAGSLAELKEKLRKKLWLPENSEFHPSPQNLERSFLNRR